MRHHRVTQVKLAGVVVTLALALTVACGGAAEPDGTAAGGDDAAPAAEGEKTTVRVGTQAGAQLVYGAYYVADVNGYFAEEGIENEFLSFDSGPLALTSLASGEQEATMAAWLPNVQAFAQGTEMQVVASLAKGNTTLIGGPSVETIKDLDGKKVGSPGIGTLHDAALTLLEQQYGIEVEHVPAKITTLPLMLRNDEIAAFIGWETVASQAVMDVEGAHYLERNPVPGNENLELALNSDVIDDDPELAQGIVNAVYKGAKYAEACPEEFIEKIAGVMNQPNALELVTAAAPSVDVTQPYIESETAELWFNVALEDGKIDVSEWNDDYAAFEADIYNPSFLEEAEKDLADWEPTC